MATGDSDGDRAHGGRRQLRTHGLRLRRPADKHADRQALGFVRRPRVSWLSPVTLVRAGLDVAISGAFGRLADKRELFAGVPQVAKDREPLRHSPKPPLYFDYRPVRQKRKRPRGRDELWIDYLSDTGDGFEATYTMAWLLAQGKLPITGPPPPEELQPGEILLLGGDQVYPAPSEEEYQNRFFGPFRAALHRPRARRPRDLYALPGNHDWYDGLTSFTRTFCNPGEFAGWYGRQTRSYWALRLPNNWWIWAIDVQLDTYIDNPQIDYFKRVAEEMKGAKHKLILLTAKPSWVKPRVEPASWRNLTFFEERVIPRNSARLVLVLTGDLHHYSRYEPQRESGERKRGGERTRGTGTQATGREAVRITAGGGGAYMSSTHTLEPETAPRPLRPSEEVNSPDQQRGEPIVLNRRTTYPRIEESWPLAIGVFKLPITAPWFCLLLSAIYVLLGGAGLWAAGRDRGGLVGDVLEGGFLDFLGGATSATTVLIAVLLCVALSAYAEFHKPDPEDVKVTDNWWAKAPVGTLHGLAHVAAVAGLVYAAAAVYSTSGADGWIVWLTAVALCAAGGYLGGSLLFALVLYSMHVIRRSKAPESANSVFASQGIIDYKNFLRLHLERNGRLTVYALGVDRVCRRWRYVESRHGKPRLEPDGERPSVKLIDDPIEFDAAGNRVD